jgi:glycosyltransferase involved in cell wall biosynthesis
MPSFRGSGLAMRAAATLKLLSQWSKNVHLLVIPIFGANLVSEPEPDIAGMISSWKKLDNLINEGVGQPSSYWNQRLRGTVPQELMSWNEEWQQRIDSAIAASNAELVFVFRFYLAPFVLPAVDSSVPVWLDIDELESNARARLAANYADTDHSHENLARMEVVAYQKLEKEMLPRFARLFVASDLEAQLVRARVNDANLHVLPNSYPRIIPQSERNDDGIARLLFVGTFGYYPNVDALLYYAREILPIIKDRSTIAVETAVIGTGLESIARSGKLPGINCIGQVDETTPYYASSDAAIVPLRCGAGTRIKILEAFSHQRAVVSTTLGAEGLGVSDNAELRIAADPEQFATRCLELIGDRNARAALARRGHEFFVKHHSATKLEEMIPELFGA